ncbi:MAG: hypothetical protein ACRENG_20675, partial [bacterium]
GESFGDRSPLYVTKYSYRFGMARELNVRLEYSPEKDVLFINILPEREVETRTKGYNHSFLVFHEKHNPKAIVGVEAMDFADTVHELESERVPLPEFDCTFNVYGSSLRGIHFKDLLKWAYGEFVAKSQFVKAA